MTSLRAVLSTAAVGTLAVGLALGPSILEVALAADRADQLARVATQLVSPASPTTPTGEPTSSPVPNPATPSTTPTATSKPTPTQVPTPKAVATRTGGLTSVPTAPPATNAAGRPVVYVTIDDGPDPTWTPQVLALLEQHRAKATFFVVGEEVARFPAVLEQVRAAGHAIGNHTYTHPWLTKLPPATVRSELAKTDALVGPTSCMRPPGGFVDARVSAIAAADGKSVELWELDTKDWAHPGVPAIVAAAKGAHAGSVLLLHDGGGDRSQSVTALKQILPALTARGFTLEALPTCR